MKELFETFLTKNLNFLLTKISSGSIKHLFFNVPWYILYGWSHKYPLVQFINLKILDDKNIKNAD